MGRRLPVSRSLLFVGGLAVSLLGSMALALPAAAQPGGGGAMADASVAVSAVKSAAAPLPSMPQYQAQPVVWPASAEAVVDLPLDAKGVRVAGKTAVGGLPVTVTPLPDSIDDLSGRGVAQAPGAEAAAKVSVKVKSEPKATTSGYPVILTVSRADGKQASGRVKVDLDYTGFRHAFGADWDARLRLFALPSCYLTTPQVRACQAQSEVTTANNVQAGVVTAEFDFSGGDLAAAQPLAADGVQARETVIGLAATAGSTETSDFSKTSLSASRSWAAGKQGGDFTYSYPMAVPQVPGGLAPDVALLYSSGSVDGQTAGSNTQPFWGEGWSYTPGYVERTYRPCYLDIADHAQTYMNATGDLCWRVPNATLVLGGKSVELVPDAATGRWKAADEDFAKVELLTGGGVNNQVWNNERWKVTTVDGTQYFFGLHQLPGWQAGDRETGSVQYVPVESNNADEPCYTGNGYLLSWCNMGYRWNLDYVIDPHGNTMSLWYYLDFNRVGFNGDGVYALWYGRSAVLGRIEYGTRTGSGATRESRPGATPAAQIHFTPADRCVTTSCGSRDRANWPDTPWDLDCPNGPCPNNLAPSFWDHRRIGSIRAETFNGTGFDVVDSWTIGAEFPDTGNNTTPVLWLSSITHTGTSAAGSISESPLLTFGTRMRNRADWDPNGTMADSQKYRISALRTEAGAQIEVTYSGQDSGCQFGSAFPDPDHNPKRCFPMYWTNLSGQSGWAWWHKYVVDKVVERDLVGGSPPVETAYSYSTAATNENALWHFTSAVYGSPNHSWNDWRGYTNVTTTTGIGAGNQSQTIDVYMRGMEQDHTDAGNFTRSAAVSDSTGASVNDHMSWQGMKLESRVLDGPGGQVLSKTITNPVMWNTAGRTLPGWQTPSRNYWGHAARPGTTTEYTWLPATSTWRTTKSTNTWDQAYGLILQTTDSGDTAISGDEACTYTAYGSSSGWNPDLNRWLIDYPSQTWTTTCATNPTAEQHLSGTQYFYDGSTALGATVTRGVVTKTNQLLTTQADWWQPSTAATYDQFGRVLDSYDALNRKTMTRYTDTAGLTSKVDVTNPAGQAVSTTYDRARGVPLKVTDVSSKATIGQYDPLGRLTTVWTDNRSTSALPNVEYQYTPYSLSAGNASSVKSRALGPNGNQIDSYTIYDGLLRERQTQTITAAGKRTIADTVYDTRGLVAKTSQFHNTDSGPTATLVTAADTAVDNQTRYTYDGAGRQLTRELWSRNVLQHKTSTLYQGDRISVTPPTGGTPTLDLIDAHGRVTEKRQYSGAPFTGAFDKTNYWYDTEGQLTTVTDQAGNTWRYTYDTLGRQTSIQDPDTGASTLTYNLAGELTSTTDARGQQLTHEYDNLGRKRKTLDGTTTLTEWVYDNYVAGQLGTTIRYAGADLYKTRYTTRDGGNRPTHTEVEIPNAAVNGALAGVYGFDTTYKANGALATQTTSAIGGLPAETLTHTYTDTGYDLALASGQATYAASTNYTYDGLVATRYLGTAGKQVKQLNTYHPATRRLTVAVTQLENSPGTFTEKYAADYSYDQAGNITVAGGGTNGVRDHTECFRYDHLRRLTEAWTQASGCATPQRAGADPYWRSWTFDATGNRLTQTDKNPVAGDTTWTYQVGTAGGVKPHQLKKVDAAGPLAATATRSFGYDAAGNTTSRTTETGTAQTLTWNQEGRLSTITEGSSNHAYVYDADGNRLISRDPTGDTLYLPDGTQVKKLAGGGQIEGTRYYTHQGQNIAVRKGTAVTWTCNDHLGTGQVQIDAATLATSRQRTAPYGEARGAQAPGWVGTKGYVGGTKDTTGLTHLGAREYDPSLGRFISRDPIIDFQDPQQAHGYAYAHNSPITFTDPDGLRDCDFADCDAFGNNNTTTSAPDYGKPSGGKPSGGRYTPAVQQQREDTWAIERARQQRLAEQRAREAAQAAEAAAAAERRRQEEIRRQEANSRRAAAMVGISPILSHAVFSNGRSLNDVGDWLKRHPDLVHSAITLGVGVAAGAAAAGLCVATAGIACAIYAAIGVGMLIGIPAHFGAASIMGEKPDGWTMAVWIIDSATAGVGSGALKWATGNTVGGHAISILKTQVQRP